MNYNEYRNEYQKAIKAYPDITNLYQDSDNESIRLTKKEYVKRCGKWIKKESKTQNIDFIHYSNIVDPRTIQFFRNLGGYEKVSKGYTKKGYLPIEVISISPDRSARSVYSFAF